MAWSPEILRRLNEAQVPYIVIGGVAAIAHGTARLTQDIDVCAELSDPVAVAIITALQDVKPLWRMRPDLGVITPDSRNLTGLRNMYLRCDLGQIDILGELPGVGVYRDLAGKAVEMDFGGVKVKVVDLDSLIEAKRFAGRDRDRQDLRQLEIIRDRLRGGPEAP